MGIALGCLFEDAWWPCALVQHTELADGSASDVLNCCHDYVAHYKEGSGTI